MEPNKNKSNNISYGSASYIGESRRVFTFKLTGVDYRAEEKKAKDALDYYQITVTAKESVTPAEIEFSNWQNSPEKFPNITISRKKLGKKEGLEKPEKPVDNNSDEYNQVLDALQRHILLMPPAQDSDTKKYPATTLDSFFSKNGGNLLISSEDVAISNKLDVPVSNKSIEQNDFFKEVFSLAVKNKDKSILENYYLKLEQPEKDQKNKVDENIRSIEENIENKKKENSKYKATRVAKIILLGLLIAVAIAGIVLLTIFTSGIFAALGALGAFLAKLAIPSVFSYGIYSLIKNKLVAGVGWKKWILGDKWKLDPEDIEAKEEKNNSLEEYNKHEKKIEEIELEKKYAISVFEKTLPNATPEDCQKVAAGIATIRSYLHDKEEGINYETLKLDGANDAVVQMLAKVLVEFQKDSNPKEKGIGNTLTIDLSKSNIGVEGLQSIKDALESNITIIEVKTPEVGSEDKEKIQALNDIKKQALINKYLQGRASWQDVQGETSEKQEKYFHNEEELKKAAIDKINKINKNFHIISFPCPINSALQSQMYAIIKENRKKLPKLSTAENRDKVAEVTPRLSKGSFLRFIGDVNKEVAKEAVKGVAEEAVKKLDEEVNKAAKKWP